MSLEIEISKAIDALVLSPVDEQRRHRAALTVCLAMQSSGDDISQIREVLDCLGLLSSP